MEKGYFGDLLTWIHDEDIQERIFHFTEKNSDKHGNRGKIWQVIELPNDFLIGVLLIDEVNSPDDKLIEFYLLSDIAITYDGADQEDPI